MQRRIQQWLSRPSRERGLKFPTVLDARIDKYTSSPYNLSEEKAHVKALNEMVKEYDITWEELK